MADILDIASCILASTGEVSTMKLQKLVYYCQAYHLVKQGKPLFDDHIEAWVNGPVVPKLFNQHRGKYIIGPNDLSNKRVNHRLAAEELCTIKTVVDVLGNYTGAQLSELTHSEDPWRNARTGLSNDTRSNKIISSEAIVRYYGSGHCPNPLFA